MAASTSIRDKVLGVLQETKQPLTAREIATKLRADRKQVANAIYALHTSPKAEGPVVKKIPRGTRSAAWELWMIPASAAEPEPEPEAQPDKRQRAPRRQFLRVEINDLRNVMGAAEAENLLARLAAATAVALKPEQIQAAIGLANGEAQGAQAGRAIPVVRSYFAARPVERKRFVQWCAAAKANGGVVGGQ